MTSTALASDPPSPPETASRAPRGAADALPVFAGDGDTAAEGLDRAAALLAEVALHRGAETPLALGVFGAAGSGKSRFLDALREATQRLAAASAATDAGPFVSRIVVARIAAAPGRDAAALLVGGVIGALAEGHAAFAEDAIHAGGDPREAARLAGERSNALRGKLDAERRSLDDLGARRARLTETVLFDGAGTRIDAFAQANRARIEARLGAFGLPSADPVRSFKEVVRADAEGGSGSRLGLILRAVWGYAGQGTLVAATVLLAALGGASGWGADNLDAVSGWLAGFGDRFSFVTDGARAHLDLLQPLSRIAFALAALALLADLVRAGRFLGPVFRGTTLLKGDLAERRRDLDGLLAHQTRRVHDLSAEAEAAGRGADVAQRRIEGHRGGGLSDHGAALAADLFGLAPPPEAAAEGFFAKVSQEMAAATEGVPERILVVLDGLERLNPTEMAATLWTAHGLLGRPGFVTLVALDRDQVATALGEFDPAGAAARLDRILQLSYDLGATPADAAALAAHLLAPPEAGRTAPAPVDASRSVLDLAVLPFESALVRRLAPFSGGTPRKVKRFVNAYRVARADPRLAAAGPMAFGMLALALALDGTGAGSELSAFEDDIAGGRVPIDAASAFGRAYAATTEAMGEAAERPEPAIPDMRRGLAVARSYGRRG